MAETNTETKEDPKKPSEEEKNETKGLSQEDIDKIVKGAVEAARKQEKDKLYGTIEELKGQVNSLTDAQKKEKEDKERAEEEAQKKANEERQAKLSVEDRMAEQLKSFEERLAKEADERKRLEEDLDKERQTAEVERYKAEVLRDAGDELVRELVKGSTREEIDNSVATAKSVYQQYFQAAVKGAEGDPGRKVQETGAKMPGPADPDPDPLDEKDLEGLVPKVDPHASGRGEVSEDYKKNRDALLARVENAYRKSSAR